MILKQDQTIINFRKAINNAFEKSSRGVPDSVCLTIVEDLIKVFGSFYAPGKFEFYKDEGGYYYTITGTTTPITEERAGAVIELIYNLRDDLVLKNKMEQ